MGEPDAFFIILKWLYAIFDVEDKNPLPQMKTMPFKPKY
jgi:hypothetical protein